MSPDGKKLFFITFQMRRELVRYDSTNERFVPYLGGIPVRLASFSRDGKWVSYRDETDGSLWRSRVDGSDCSLPFRLCKCSTPRGRRTVRRSHLTDDFPEKVHGSA
jgi:hypothetical protein